MPSQVALFWLNELFFFFFYFLCLTADFLYVMHLASLHSFTRNLFPKHEATQLSTILQTWSNWGLWKLAYIPGNSYCIPWSHLLSCHWLKVLQWARWSHDQWLNGLFVLLSSLTDDLLQCKINSWCWYISAWSQILYYFFFLSTDNTPALKAILLLWYYTTIQLCIGNISNHQTISIFHYYILTSRAKVRNGNISSNIFMKFRKIRSVAVLLRKSIDKRKSILLSVKCLINDIMLA